MGLLLYNLFLFLFRCGVVIAAPFNPKARKWLAGRKKLIENLAKGRDQSEKTIWMHCASLGEFEQGRPVLEKLRTVYPGYRILLTFFSPSGYEIQKDYKGADRVSYLPLDGRHSAKQFLEIVQPSLVIFVKYEYWYHYLKQVNKKGIPLLLISAFFKPGMVFFKWYGGLFRKMLSFFDHLFVQDEDSKSLLDSIGFGGKTTVAGDTRFDRVVTIAQKPGSIPLIEEFAANEKIMVAGSTWPNDEEILQESLKNIPAASMKLIIAPHEIHEKHINGLKRLFPSATLYSQLPLKGSEPLPDILIIDNIGMLSRLYKYAHITYVGGGFNKSGIHNILEAAVYGKPVIWGPYFARFKEAFELIETGAGFSVNDSKQLSNLALRLLKEKETYTEICFKAEQYVIRNSGATNKINGWIQEKRLLTN